MSYSKKSTLVSPEKNASSVINADVTAHWKVSLRAFALGTLSLWCVATANLTKNWLTHATTIFGTLPCMRSLVVIQAVVLGILRCVVKPSQFGIAWRGNLLGIVFNIGLTLALYLPEWRTFGFYLMALSIFHWSEYMMQSIYNPLTTTTDSYMLYHSNEYVAAACVSLLEFLVENYFWPEMKQLGFISGVGMCLVITGESLRKIAMWTAKSNFNHYVQYNKSDGHELVTSGVYSLFRHPSYVGWFWWSIGTQLMLCNIFCTVAYAFATWKFFHVRIFEEESTLISFFGEKYVDYQQRVGTGLPYIQGFRIESYEDRLRTSN